MLNEARSGLWRGGGSLMIVVVILCGLAARVSSQALCDSPGRIFVDKPVRGNTSEGFVSTTFGTCGTSNDVSPEVFYLFEAPNSGVYQVDSCGSTADQGYTISDSKISVYSGTCDEPVCVAGNDDFCSRQSGVVFSAEKEAELIIMVHGWSRSEGTFEVVITQFETDIEPCQEGKNLEVDKTYQFNSQGATTTNFLACGPPYLGTGQFFRFEAPSESIYKVASPNRTSVISVLDGTCRKPGCVSSNPTCLEEGSSCITVSEGIFDASRGQRFIILVHGFSSSNIDYDLKITEFVVNPLPCQASTEIFLNTPLRGDTTAAVASNFPQCKTIHETGAGDLFYRFVVPEDGEFLIDTCGFYDSPVNTKISIFTGTCDAPVCLDGNDDFCGQLSKVSLTVVAGTELLIMVHSSGTTTGEFELTISKFAVTGCENTTDLITLDRPVYGSSREGIRSPSIPSCGARNYGGLARFYRFISPKKAFYEMDTCLTDSGFDTQLSVYRGSCSDPLCVAGNDDFCSRSSSVSFLGQKDEEFIVMVHGWSGREGDFALEVRVIMDGQESCEDAQEIFLDTSLTGDTGLGFTSSFPECGTTNDPWSADVFFKFVAPNIGLFELDTCENSIANSHTDTKINVYSGGCDAPVCLNGNDDKCGFRSSLTFNSTFAGEEFLVMVHAFRRSTGPFDLRIKEIQLDQCEHATEIFLGDLLDGHTKDGSFSNLPDCGVSNRAATPEQLYKFKAPRDSTYTVDTCESPDNTDTMISVYAFCEDSVCLAGNDDAQTSCNHRILSRVTFLAAKGTYYLFRVEPYSERSGGPYVIRVTDSETGAMNGSIQEERELNRPNLVESSLIVRESQVMNHYFEYAQVTLDFDQKLFLNEPLLCPDAEKACTLPSSSCDDCNWTNVQAACWGSNCCSSPCEVEPEGFLTVPLNEKSESVYLNSSGIQYFRFILSDSDVCSPVQVSVLAEYGNARLLVSNTLPFPEWDQRTNNGNIFSDPSYHYSQASVTLCPQFSEKNSYSHTPGIYSVGVFALEPTDFRLEVSVGMTQPIPQPRERVLCENVPEEEFTIARGTSGSTHDVFCLEDSVTKIVHSAYENVDLSNQVILPFPAGCHLATFLAAGVLSEGADVYCFPTMEDDIVKINTSTIGRRKANHELDSVTFTACSEEPFYVHCSYHFWQTEYYKLLFTTTAIPKRTPLVDIRPGPLAMSTGLGAIAATIQGEEHQPCVDWQKGCNEFLTPSLSDPLPLWPPPGDMWIVTGPFESPLPPDRFIELGLADKMENRVTFIKYLSKANNRLLDSSTLLSSSSLSIFALTNEAGDPVLLPNNGPTGRSSFRTGAPGRSFLNYIPNIAFSSLTQGSFPVCDLDKYTKHLSLVNDTVSTNVLGRNTFDEVIPSQYTIDVYNVGYARTSCLAAAANLLSTEVSETVQSGQTGCKHPKNSADWLEDPCCNPAVVPIACCAPSTEVVEDTVYTEADRSSLETCTVQDCAKSYLDDLAESLNTFTDPVTGCASIIQKPDEERQAVIEEQLDRTMRSCAQEVGLGDTFRGAFTGVQCAQDSDCGSTLCNRELGVCALPSQEEMEKTFLECYILRMSYMTEDFLRETIFEKSFGESGAFLDEFDRFSPEFYQALLSISVSSDCVNSGNALDLSQRNHTKISIVDQSCATNYVATISPDPDQELVDRMCSPQYCLGESCRFRTDGCYMACGVQSELESSNETCIEAEEKARSQSFCTVDSTCDGGSVCVYCPDDGTQCQSIQVSGGQEECESMFMCVLPNRTKFLTQSQEECESAHSECSVDCAGSQCRGGSNGVCRVAREQTFDNCTARGGENTVLLSEPIAICLLKNIATEADCMALSESDLVWDSCESLEVDSCHYENFSPGHVYLGCAVEPFRTCETQEECEGSGRCSDLEVLRQVVDPSFLSFVADNDIPSKETRDLDLEARSLSRAVKRNDKSPGAQYGACLTSGTHLVDSILASRIPYCAFGEMSLFGCHEDLDEEECGGFVEYFGSFWRWQQWVKPALSESECLADVVGHSGCQLPGSSFHHWFWNSSACDCRRGVYENTWTWTPGRWVSGQARPLQWIEAKPAKTYEYKQALSFQRLEEWVRRSAEQQFTDSVKSQIICETNLITSSLSTILCDCLTEDDDNLTCYSDTDATTIEVGFRDVCAGEVIELKGPSNSIVFDETAVIDRCTKATLSMIRKSAFAVSRFSASVSFQFEKPAKPGVVLNQKGATIGKLHGDGASLTFAKSSLVSHFRACLRITVEGEVKGVRDFGYTTGDIIYPLEISDSIEVEVRSLEEYWCAVVERETVPTTTEGELQIFPISHVKNWVDEDDESYSDSTIALVYTLGALYLLDFVLLSVFLLNLLRQATSQKTIPIVAWIGGILIILCIFRIVFCFMWPNEAFGDNSLAEYVVFEIPTFLLFSLVILSISFFRKLSRTRTFFFQETPKKLFALTGVSIILVWCLFAVVAIVYSEVILEDNESTTSCPGRVEASSNLDEETRTLSIIYQSIVIFFTFLLAILFWCSSYELFKITNTQKKLSKTSTFVFRLGAILVTCFMLRCVLFLILLAVDFTSAPYLFVTLFLTEVLMIFLVQLEFNKHFYRRLASSTATSITSRVQSAGSRSGQMASATGQMASGMASGTNVSAMMDN